MQRILLLTVSLTVLYYSCLVDGMPLSWGKSVRHRRSRTEASATEPPTFSSDPGRIQQHELENNPNAGEGGATNSSANETTSVSVNETKLETCMRQCYNSRVPLEAIHRLKKDIAADPHPNFYLSEWMENEHRLRFCMLTVPKDDDNLFCEDEQEQLQIEISEELKNETLEAFKNKDYSCISNYEITYHNFTQNIYPRYLFQVQCQNEADRIIRGMKSLKLNKDRWDIIIQPSVSVGCQ